MEQVASAIVSKMLSADLISENETEQYNYSVQVLLEKLISYAILFGLAWLLHCLVEVVLFFVSFSIIRKYSGGIHCKRLYSGTNKASDYASFNQKTAVGNYNYNYLPGYGGAGQSYRLKTNSNWYVDYDAQIDWSANPY